MPNCIIINGGTTNPSEHYSKIQRTLGAYRIASALNEYGYSTFVFDYIAQFNVEEIIQVLKNKLNEETLWVGFSSTFFWPKNVNHFLKNKDEKTEQYKMIDEMYWDMDYSNIKKIIDFIKNNSKAKIVYGGSKAQFSMCDKNIDYYVLGNADVSILDLTDYLAGKKPKIEHLEEIDIDGVTCFKIDSFKYPEPKMDNLTTKWWDENFNVLPGESLPIEMARGCIFKCKFCAYPLLGKKKGTYLRSADEIRDELIQTYESIGTTSYSITDDTFNDDNEKLEKLHKIFTNLPFKVKLSCYLRIDLMNKFPHQAQLLSEMGLVGAFFGIETLQAESARAIGKGLPPNKVKDRLYWLSEQWKNKVNMSSGFILGLPYDTTKYFDELFDWTMKDDNPLQDIMFYPLLLFKSTNKDLERYSSEFSLNSEIYGYEFDTISNWKLPSQDLTYESCKSTSEYFYQFRKHKNKISAFAMHDVANLGISYEDMFKFTEFELIEKYNIPELNQMRIQEYKNLIL